jgi:hypothetical protein
MLQHIWRRRGTWTIAAVLALAGGVACSDDSSDNDNDGTAGKGGSSASGKGGSGGKGGAGGSRVPVTPSDELKGTGADCQSFTELTDDKCQGWYCGVSEAELVAAIDPKARCGGDPVLLCKGTVTTKVGACARKEKEADPAAANDVLRPKIRDCAYEDAEVKEKVPEDCLNCIIDVAACAGDKCLGPCLGGDTETCDNCRLSNGCDAMVFSCGELPSPLE